MSGLDSLIRLHRWKLEEKRRVLADLESLMDELRTRAGDLEVEILDEQKAAAGSEEAGFAYAAYATQAIHRRGILAQSAAELEGKIEAARDDVKEAFQEAKKYEIAQERKLERERIVMARRERIAEDDVALDIFRRKS
ncbi:MAG: flagellar FliJ family protein [Proteobacteria bacterium]|nr:flagellar FliJ family protein [Pseudomonadota bacterium]